MCKPASFIITEDKVFWSKKTDSHEDIIKEFCLIECDRNGGNGKPMLVRVEICPPDEDYKQPLKEWVFKTDQNDDLLPDWYDAKEAEKRTRRILKDWLKAKVILPHQAVDAISTNILAIYGKVKYIGGSAQVKYIRDSAQVEYICGSAQVEYICGSAQVEYIRDSAQVEYIRDSAQVEYICGSAQVEYIRDSAQVKTVGGKVVICTYNNLSPDILKSSQAVMIDRSGDIVKCYVGKDK